MKNPRSFIKFILIHGIDQVSDLIKFNSMDWSGKPIEDQERLNTKESQLKFGS